MKTKSIQIKLRDNVPVERALMEHLERLGTRSGEPKRLLLRGFSADVSEISISDTPKDNIEEPAEVSAFASLAVKG